MTTSTAVSGGTGSMAVSRILVSALTLLAAPLLVSLSGCGGHDASVADPPIRSGSSSSPTQTTHRESPEHFIRRWAAAEKHMENTGVGQPYLTLSRGCGPCHTLAAQVAHYYDAGGYVRWGGWQIKSIRPYPGKPLPLYSVTSLSKPTKYQKSSNAPVQHFSGGPITYVLALKRTGTSWVVTDKSELQT